MNIKHLIKKQYTIIKIPMLSGDESLRLYRWIVENFGDEDFKNANIDLELDSDLKDQLHKFIKDNGNLSRWNAFCAWRKGNGWAYIFNNFDNNNEYMVFDDAKFATKFSLEFL